MLLTEAPGQSAAFTKAVCCLLSVMMMMISSRCCGADVVTFNVSEFASLTLNETPSAVGFELRTSHPAWGIWSLRSSGAAPADEPLLRLGLTPTNLTVSWPAGNRREISVGLLDGRWHRIYITLNSSSTGGLSILIDGIAMPPIANWSLQLGFNATSSGGGATPLTLFTTFGGVNGTAGLRGCLANASLNGEFVALLRMSSGDPASGRNFSRTSGCQEDPCPCLNTGRCRAKSQWNMYTGCNCTDSGFLGALCQSPDPCWPDPCNSPRGNCSVIGNPEWGNLTSRCTCLPGYLSPNCTSPEPQQQQQQQDTRLVVGLVVGLMLLLVLGTAAGVGICVLRDRRKDTGVYKPSDRELGGNGAQSLRSVLHPPAEERLV